MPLFFPGAYEIEAMIQCNVRIDEFSVSMVEEAEELRPEVVATLQMLIEEEGTDAIPVSMITRLQ